MIRIVLSIVVPLVLPTLLYFAYAWLLVRRARAKDPTGSSPPPEIDVPWWGLAIAGLLLTMVSMAINFVDTGARPGTHYEPARIEGGRVVPGRNVP